MKLFMKSIDINFRYWGDVVKASVFQEEDKIGVVYPIQLNGHYSFTLYYTQRNEWVVLKNNRVITKRVDKELLSRIVKPLEVELKYAA